MLWEVELRPIGRDAERERVCDEMDLLTSSERGADLVVGSCRGFLIEGEIAESQAKMLARKLLTDPLTEECQLRLMGEHTKEASSYTVLLKPGVMDPVSESVLRAARDLGVNLTAVRTFRRYFGSSSLQESDREILFKKVLANDAIEQIVSGNLKAEHLALGKTYTFHLITVPLRDKSNAELIQLSKDGQLALSLEEMQVIQAHFRTVGRDPTDIELETIAQTWSEHCSHKTLKGAIEYTETIDGKTHTKRFENLLKETVFAATQTLRKQFGKDDWCVSVFADNAGVVTFDDKNHICFKVETHNHPSAIEPYGGANTGLGGVIRDPLGTGLGAKPICNTDVFCFARPDFDPEQLPKGVMHPRRIIQGVVSGVRDYGNRMGIPTVNGAIMFDDRYLANPLVFCGTVGLIPKDMAFKAANPGDLIVALGGRTGRDGIHGATFSSLELSHESDVVSGGAVQIGNAITEKKVLDIVLQARDRHLFSAITDCGAGGFSSAVGEMGADLGANVHLDQAPLKYEGLSYTEIWISESQERMVLAVPPANWPALQQLCASEDVEVAVLGTFEATGKLKLNYKGQQVGELDMHFLHDGLPRTLRKAEWQPSVSLRRTMDTAVYLKPEEALLRILGSLSVCSKEWVIRQYDHEVQGGSVIKPLVGIVNDGPSDAAVVNPVLGSKIGVAIGCGLNPLYGEIDPYHMAAVAIDEALRNVVAVGADPKKTAILDNFCWGNIHDPAILGALVRTSQACYDVAVAFKTPFISGKDSLNNTYLSHEGNRVSIPHTLLISAMGQVPDITKCVSMDLKEVGNALYLVGITKNELGGSHFHVVTDQAGGNVPTVDVTLAPRIFQAVHEAISAGLVRACHDLSEGGLAVAVAEMAFAGGIGAEIDHWGKVEGIESNNDIALLFSESATRFVVEVQPANVAAFEAIFRDLPCARVGQTVADPVFRVTNASGTRVIQLRLSEMKEAWQKPLRW